MAGYNGGEVRGMSQPNRRDSDQDTVVGTLKTFDLIAGAAMRLWSRIPRERGPITAVVLLLLAVGLGYGLGYGTRSVVSPGQAGLPGATTIDGKEVGVIDSAIITNAPADKTPTPQGQFQYMVYVKFPDPGGSCDKECQRAVRDVTQGEGCGGGTCIAQFKNLDDQNGKNNSTTLQNILSNAANTGEKFKILFSGTRKHETSDYPNMLLIEPSSG